MMPIPKYLGYQSTESSAESLASWNVRSERPQSGEDPFSGPEGVRRAWEAWANNFSSKTRGVYGEGLTWLARYLEISDPLEAVQHVANLGESFGTRKLVEWEQWLRDVRGNGPRTLKARRLAVLQAFRLLYACKASAWVPQFPRRRVEDEKAPLHALGMQAAEKFVGKIESSSVNDWRSSRDRAIAWLAFGCGIPLASISTLDVSDVIYKDNSLRVRFGREDSSFLHPLPPVRAAILDWMKERPDADGLKCLFPGYRTGGSQKIRWTRLDSRGIWALLRRRFDASGFNLKLRKGGFRHSAILTALVGEEKAA